MNKNWLHKFAYALAFCLVLLSGAILSLTPNLNPVVQASETSFAASTFSSVDSDGVSLYAIKISSLTTPVIGVGASYFPSAYSATQGPASNGSQNWYGAKNSAQSEMFVVNYGDTVFLADGEYLLLAFGRTGLIDKNNKESQFFSTTRVGGALNVTYYIDGVASNVNPRNEELSPDGNNYFYQYGHIFDKNSPTFQEGHHKFVFGYGIITNSGTVQLGKVKDFEFQLFKKETYNKNNDTANGVKQVVLTPNAGFTSESVTGFVSTDMNYYNENFFSYNNKTLNVNKLMYPRFVYDASKVEIEIEKTYNKQTSKINITSQLGIHGAYGSSNGSNLVKLSLISDYGITKTQVEFFDVGEYTISYHYVYFDANGQKMYLDDLDSVFLKEKVTVFGYQMFYSQDYNGKAEFRKFFERKEYEFFVDEEKTVAADVSFAVSHDYIYGGTQAQNLAFVNAVKALVSSKVVSTNQSPLKFDFAANLDLGKSLYWKLNDWNDFETTSPTFYDGSNFLSPGKYVVKMSYTYSKYKDPGTKTFDAKTEHSQLFIFEITNAMPVVEIQTLKTNPDGTLFLNETQKPVPVKALQDGEFTNQIVRVIMPKVGYFDSKVKVIINNDEPLIITPSESDETIYSELIEVATGAFKKTTVRVEFGKDFSSSSIKSFTIDRAEIGNVQTAVLNSQRIKIGRLTQSEFILNQSFALEWNEKASGSKTWATYKFIPISSHDSYVFASPLLEGETKIPIANGRYLNYQTSTSGSGQQLAQTPYTNTISTSYAVSANSVLSTDGLYLFEIYDQAGNKASHYVLLDRSAPMFLQKEKVSSQPESFAYVFPKSLNVVSNSTIVEWGTHKAIALGLFGSTAWKSYTPNDTAGIDPWVLAFQRKLHENDMVYTKALERSPGVSVNVDFLTIPITAVRIFVNESREILNQTSSFRAEVFGDEGEENEADYKFFTIDASHYASNLNGKAAFFNAPLAELSKNASGTFALRTTTDMALSTVYLSNGVNSSLIQKDGDQSDKVWYTQKSVYYKASNALQLRFKFEENIGNNIVANVKFYFYPMVFSVDNKTLSYATSGVELFENSHYRVVMENEQKTFILQIPVIAGNNSGETLQGKYEIVRTYHSADENLLSEDDLIDYITSKKDYLERKFTAYIDHNILLTTPDVYGIVNGSSNDVQTIKKVGEFWKLTVEDETFNTEPGAGEDRYKVVFKDFFRQDNLDSPIVKTNKNPVEILIPYSMYGTNKQISENKYFDSGMYHDYLLAGNLQEIAEFFLNIRVQKLYVSGSDNGIQELAFGKMAFQKTTGALLAQISGEASAYLTFDYETKFWSFKIPSGDNFIGTYRIVVENNLSNALLSSQFAVENESFDFVVEVISPTPVVNFTATIPYPNGDEVANVSNQIVAGENIGFTNGKSITATWVDPIDDFIIKIDTQRVFYSVNGEEQRKLSPTLVGTTHTGVAQKYDITGNILDFAHGDEIVFYFNMVGKDNTFVYTKKIRVDTVAPTTNLQKLLQSDNLVQATSTETKEQLLRTVGLRYNRSRSTGNYRFYAFALDLESSFQFEIGAIGDTSRVYFTTFTNKYSSSPYERTLPGDPSQSSQSNRFLPLNYSYIVQPTSLKSLFRNISPEGQIYEIVEADVAGNFTIYSIFVYSSALTTNTVNSSSLLNSSINLNETSEANRVIRAIDFVQINEINTSNDQWLAFSLNGKTYLKSPFIHAQRANSFMTYDNLGSPVYLSLAEISATLIPNKLDYVLQVRSRQLGIVNVRISLVESTRYFMTEIKESTINNVNRLTLTVFKNHAVNDPNGQLGLTRVKLTINDGLSTVVQTINFNLSDRWEVVIDQAKVNVMYAFELYDNFRGLSVVQSSIRHIFGAAALVNPPFEMVDKSNDFVYNSTTKTITTSKAIDFLFVEAYLKDGRRVKVNEDNQGPLDAIVPETTNPIKRITLYPSNEVNGGLKTYFITVEYHGDASATIYTVYIFNKHSEAFLRDDAGNDKADLFRGSVTTDPVVGTFVAGNSNLTGPAANLFETKIYYRFNNEPYQLLQNGTRFVAIGNYQYLYQVLVGNKVLLEKYDYFTISKEGISTFAIRVQRGSVYETLSPSGTRLYNSTWIPEYISNASVFRVDLNSNLFLQYVILKSPAAGLTKGEYVIRISNKTATQKPSIYFETTIAITLIEETQNILTNPQNTTGATTFSYYTSGIAIAPVITSDSGSYRLITSMEENSGGVTIIWPTYFGTENNKVLLTLKQNGQTILMGDNSGFINLKTSGQYTFSFRDVAGNKHYFTFRQSGAYITSDEYTIHYLASVVFLMREITQPEPYSGIQNAVYNNAVAISVPDSTINIYYDISARPTIFVERNGSLITVQKTNNEWILTEPGLYKVYFRAKARPTVSGASANWLPETPLVFTIVNPNESRWAFEFLEYDNYEVTKLNKNQTSILTSFRNNPLDRNEKVRGFVLSYYDTQKTGKGRYDITIQTSALQSFSFSVWINDGEIPIVISVKEGTVTTGKVSVQFNMQNIYNNIGDCYVTMRGLTPIQINSEKLSQSNNPVMDITLSEKGEYFVQVFTAGGTLMFSYRFEIKEPLNTISVIVIVVTSLTVVVLSFIFFKIRKKIQVK